MKIPHITIEKVFCIRNIFPLMNLLAMVFLLVSAAFAQQRQIEIPDRKPVNTERSSGIDAGDYLYISGQGPQRPDGSMPSGFDAQATQALENVKAIVVAAGLSMEHVVYVQVYLEEVSNCEGLNRIFAKYFPHTPPARAVLGVARVPQSPIEITAVAVRDLTGRKAVIPLDYKTAEPFSPGILTHDRLFVSAMQGRDPRSGQVPDDPVAQTNLALDGLKAVVEVAGLTLSHLVFVNPYLTQKIPMERMNEQYARRFEFGNTPARATIEVPALPGNAQIEYTGVAVRDLRLRRAIRPKNMPPSPTASPCVFAGDTLYCSAKSGFIPGPHGGVYGNSTAAQLRQTMRNQLDNLEEASMDFSQVVSTTVYLDNISESEPFNKVYSEYFKAPLPAQTMVQQLPPTIRSPDAREHFPDLEQMSLIAVIRHPGN
ncbi:MAG TPA: RidA family protein [Candidatus Acidoferrum sp.]|nr:RidA family protein [Candidatus Acidoferrum sp.]